MRFLKLRSALGAFGTAVLLLAHGVTAQASVITIGSYSNAVAARPFVSSDYSNLISDLSNPANFGAAGINKSSVVIASAVASVNAATLSGYDVFVIDEATSLPVGNAAAIASWVIGGGRLVLVNDSSGAGAAAANAILSLLDGSSVTSTTGGNDGTGGGTISGSGLSSNGLFGNLVGGTFATTPGSALIAGSHSSIIGTSAGTNFLMETLAGSGAVLTTADVSFQNYFVPPGTIYSNNDNALLFENFMPVKAQVQQGVPEPDTVAMLGLGLLGLLQARRRRKAR